MILVQEALIEARGAETGNGLSSVGTKNNTVNNCSKANNSLNAIALFSGGGGLSRGVKLIIVICLHPDLSLTLR